MIKFYGKEMLIQSHLWSSSVVKKCLYKVWTYSMCLLVAISDVQVFNVWSFAICSIFCPMSSVQCPATRVAGEGGGGVLWYCPIRKKNYDFW